MAGTTYDSIQVEGHAGRLGSDQYNQKLSQERTDSVKSYLVNSDKFDGAKGTSTDKEKSASVTLSFDFEETKATPSLAACLQLDRLVDVEVTCTQ